MPVKDVAKAGGGRDTATLLECYQQSDEETLTEVVLDAPKLTTNGVGQGAITTLFTPPEREGPVREAGNG